MKINFGNRNNIREKSWVEIGKWNTKRAQKAIAFKEAIKESKPHYIDSLNILCIIMLYSYSLRHLIIENG